MFLNVVDPDSRGAARGPRHDAHGSLASGRTGPGAATAATDAIAANERDVVKRTVIDLGLTSTRQVRALEFMPGDRRVVRAATFSVERTGQWLGSWTPWHGFVTLPDNVAYRLPAGTRIVADIHYRGASERVDDRGTLGVFFAIADRRARSATDLVVETRARLHAHHCDTTVWAIQPEIVAGLSSLEVSARRPDGGTDVLLALTDPSPDWPTPYLLKTPRLLARGSELFVVARSKTTPPSPMRVSDSVAYGA